MSSVVALHFTSKSSYGAYRTTPCGFHDEIGNPTNERRNFTNENELRLIVFTFAADGARYPR